MDFSDFQADAALFLGESAYSNLSSAVQTQVDLAINSAVETVWNWHDWRFKQGKAMFSLVAGDYQYTLDNATIGVSDFDYALMFRAVDPSDGGLIEFIPLNEFRDKQGDTTDTSLRAYPSYATYTSFETDSTADRLIEVTPVPDAATSMELWYMKRFTTMTGSALPSGIPLRWHRSVLRPYVRYEIAQSIDDNRSVSQKESIERQAIRALTNMVGEHSTIYGTSKVFLPLDAKSRAARPGLRIDVPGTIQTTLG